MSKTIAVAGKGGTGKTTISGLIIRHLVQNGKTPVLAVDADPNNNLHETLGVTFEKTVVSLVDELMADKDNLPPGMTKERYLELNFQDALVENKGFDLLVMGHPEREGCYCAANNMLRRCMDTLSANYPYIVMDNEAGMEHLSRRTTRNVDYLLVIANPTAVSLKSALRIQSIAEELKLNVKKTCTVLNELIGPPGGIASPAGLDILGRIPYDGELLELGLAGKSVFDLPDEAKAGAALSELMGKLGF